MKKLIIIAVLLMAMTGVIFAQSLPRGEVPTGIIESPASIATRGFFPSEADYFISPGSFTEMDFNTFYSMTSFDGDSAVIGVGTYLYDMYFGLYYGGNLFTGRVPFSKSSTDSRFPNWDGAGIKKHTIYSVNPYNALKGNTQDNRFAILVGLEDLNMGFRFSFASTHQSFREKETEIAGTPYRSYRAGYGVNAVQLAWAMTEDLLYEGIRPYASLDLIYFRDNERYERYARIGTNPVDTLNEQYANSRNFWAPSLKLGSGDYTLIDTAGGVEVSANVEYQVTFAFHSRNKYSTFDGVRYRTHNSDGYFTYGEDIDRKITYANNVLTPSVDVSWDSERIGLAAGFALGFNFTNEKEVGTSVDVSNNYRRKTFTNSEFTFALEPSFSFGLQYRLIPSKLNLNAGADIEFSSIGVNTEKLIDHPPGARDETRNLSSPQYGTTSTGLYLGAEFNLTQNVGLQAMTGLNNAKSVSVFQAGPNGLFYFGSILLSLKF